MKTEVIAEPSLEQAKAIIRCIHSIWYKGDFFTNKGEALNLHQHLSSLFNFAGITDTLCENNPDKVTPEEFMQMPTKPTGGERGENG